MKKTILSCCLCIAAGVVTAQSNQLDKKLEKAYDLTREQKYKEADEYVENIVTKNPEYGAGWDLLAKIRYQEYEDSKATDGIFGNMTVTMKDKDGKETQGDDSLKQQLMKMLNEVKPSKIAYSSFMYSMRRGTASSREAATCSAYLRMLNIDTEVDTNVGKKALKYFSDAEKEFSSKNYNAAAVLYKRALETQPDFYKAALYLGDCYYFTGNYTEAIGAFKAASERFPNLLEPRKYLTDAYAKAKLYDKAVDEAINTMMVYPDFAMYDKLDDAVYLTGSRLNIGWTARGVLPNTIKDTSNHKSELYKPKKEMKAEGPWLYYEKALEKITPYCNTKGIIVKANSITQAKYMELYSWEEMLKNSNDPSLAEAKKMQQDGYLDCYVMVSCFHYDFYDQYKHFVANNRDKIAKYYKRYIVSQ